MKGESIDKLRNAIDEIDEEILNLLNKRIEIAQRIGRIKKENNLPVYVPEREETIISRLKRKNPGPINEQSIQNVFNVIIEETRLHEAL